MPAGSGPTALVGRDAELARLDASCRAAIAGRGSLVCMVGPAGIGKTRLLRGAIDGARRLGLTTAASWCWAEGAPPLWPWVDLLDQLAPNHGPLAGQAFDVFRQVEDAIMAAVRSGPLLLSVDDLHLADEATLLLSRYLARRAPGLPLLLLFTHRPPAAEGGREAELLADIDGSGDPLVLSPLGVDAVADLAAEHGHPALPRAAVEALTAASGGVPLQAVTALDACRPGATVAELTTKIQVSVASRLRRLHPRDAAVIARAAVLGRDVSTAAVARICGCDEASVRAATAAALTENLVRPGGRDRIVFAHDLLREALVDLLDPDDLLDAHAAAAALHRTASPAGPGDVVVAARHALLAARRSASDTEVAVLLSERAAEVLADGGAPEDGVTLLEQAIEVNEQAGRRVPPARLLLARASAVLRAGRLAEANTRYQEATEAALAEGDPVGLAEAAAGLGGLWVNSVRAPVDQRRVLRVQRRALAGLPPGHGALALRLRARIAGEAMFWEGASADDLLEVLDDVRRLGNAGAVLEVLSIAHNPLLDPAYGPLRLQLSEEMLAVAADAPGGILPLMALCWRAVDLFLAGDEGAERALADLRSPAEALQVQSILYVVRVIETMLLIRAGRLPDAERAAEAALELGTRVQDADALSYYGAHLLTLRWFQGRDAEVLELVERIATSANLDVVDLSFESAVAALAARAGHHDVARRHLRRVTRAGLATLPRFSTWLAAMAGVVEAAVALDETSTVGEAYELLLPHSDLPVTPSLAVTCFGSVQRWLGIAALATGEPDRAERHLRAAVEANLRLGNVPATALTRAELAGVLAGHRPSPERAAEARALLRSALDTAARLGLDTFGDRWQAALADLEPSGRMTLTRLGNGWSVEYAGRAAVVRDLAGTRHLAALVSAPGRWIPAVELAAGFVAAGSSAQPMLDPAARRALEGRARELAGAVGAARERGDLATQAAVEEELDALATQLAAGIGLYGRARSFPDEAERARTAVRKAVVRAFDEIARTHPSAGAHLRRTVVTGTSCSYQPSADPTVSHS